MMPSYAIGDVQGCYQPLLKLLAAFNYNPAVDRLYFVGDLVNRGPDSLSVLRFLKAITLNPPIITLGNHDLHLLAVHYGVRAANPQDTLHDILTAPDRDQLCDWLRQQRLLYYHKDYNMLFAHAGIAPQWSVQQAQKLAREVEDKLRVDPENLCAQMYGNQPNYWDEQLQGWERLRVIINYFTRMRFCDPEGRLEFKHKQAPHHIDNSHAIVPWYKISWRKTKPNKIIFGHWAALEGRADTANIYALDTGCVWGGRLTALRLEDEKIFTVANS